jgi:hypothetical protein
MKKVLGAALVGIMLLLGSALPGFAWGRGGGFHGHGFHHDGHVFVRSHVFIGAPFFIGDPFWWGPWPYYSPPPVVVQPSSTTYLQQGPAAPTYWYYCQSPQGYYPYVTQCPGGWLTVVPPVQPPAQ